MKNCIVVDLLLKCLWEHITTLTHCNLIDFRHVQKRVVLFECLFAKSKWCFDGWWKSMVLGVGSQMVVDEVHSWDDSCEIQGSTGKEQSHIFENLWSISMTKQSMEQWCQQPTFSTSLSCCTMVHSGSFNSYIWRSLFLSAIKTSIAFQYSSAKFSIS